MNETEYEFRLGDRVRAKENAPYGITTNGWIGYVVRERTSRGYIGVWTSKRELSGYMVNPEYFDLIDENGNPIFPEQADSIEEMSDSISDSDMMDFISGGAR